MKIVVNPISGDAFVMIERLRQDKIRFEKKAEFYELLWQKLEELESIYDETISESKWNKLYQIWRIASERCDKYNRIASDIAICIDSMEYTIQDVIDIYDYINRQQEKSPQGLFFYALIL